MSTSWRSLAEGVEAVCVAFEMMEVVVVHTVKYLRKLELIRHLQTALRLLDVSLARSVSFRNTLSIPNGMEVKPTRCTIFQCG